MTDHAATLPTPRSLPIKTKPRPSSTPCCCPVPCDHLTLAPLQHHCHSPPAEAAGPPWPLMAITPAVAPSRPPRPIKSTREPLRLPLPLARLPHRSHIRRRQGVPPPRHVDRPEPSPSVSITSVPLHFLSLPAPPTQGTLRPGFSFPHRTERHAPPPKLGRRRRSTPPPLPYRPSRLQPAGVVVSKLSPASFNFTRTAAPPAARRPRAARLADRGVLSAALATSLSP
jgi:hypothetical protein